MQVYLKPRPISHQFGHSNYLTFKYPFDNYRPFFADYGTIPSDATEVYTVRLSSPLSASLAKLYNELLPSFDAEVPDPNKLPRSAWHGILQLAVAKVDSSFFFQLECENHIVRLVKGDRAPAPPPASRRIADLSPEWYNIVYGTLLRGEVEVRDDTELELFIWAYLYSEANEQVHIWRGLRREMLQLTRPFFAAHLPSAYTDNSGLLKAVSAIASVFATKTPIEPPPLTPSSMDENKPPLFCPSSSSSHADSDNDSRPFRRRNRIVSSANQTD